MGVDHQHTSGHTATTPSRESSSKRVKAGPAVGIYRPPAARRLDHQVSAAPIQKQSSPAVETKLEKTRPARQRRPDIQVYVPRAKRLLAGSGTSTSCKNSPHQSLDLTYIKGENSQPATASEQNHSHPLADGELATRFTSVPHHGSGWSDSKAGDESRSQCSVSPSITSNFSLQVDHKEKQTKFGTELVQVSPESSQSRERKSTELKVEERCLDNEDLGGSGRRISQRASSSTNTPEHNGRNSLDLEQQVLEAHHSTTDHCPETVYNHPQQDAADSQKDCDVMLGNLDFSECSVEEMDVDCSYTCRGSRSPSCNSTRQSSPLSLTENDGQTWDYFSEIKNATNRAHNKVIDCKMDSSECDGIAEDSRQLTENSVTHENSECATKCCDNSDQFQNCLDTDSENSYSYGSAQNDFTNSEDTVKPDCQSEDKPCSEDIFTESERKKNTDDECKVQEEQNRKNRRIIRGNFVSDVLIISDPEPVASKSPPKVDPGLEKTSSPERVLTKKKKVQHRNESASTDTSSTKSKSAGEQNVLAPSKVLNPDECTWEMLFDDNGDCLDPKLMEELTSAVGSVAIEKPQSDYRSYQSRVELLMSGDADDEFSHVLEIYNFPPEFKTQDLYAVFSPYMKGGFEIKWVDDTHALGVFSSSLVAAEVLGTDHPFVKTRPLHLATHESRMKARRSAEFLQPYRARPETCMALARRLVTGALGVRLNTTPEEREAERKILKDAREKKKLAARQREEAWEGTLGEK